MVLRFIKTLWNDWRARMVGQLSLILLFIPILAPQFTAKYLWPGTYCGHRRRVRRSRRAASRLDVRPMPTAFDRDVLPSVQRSE